MKETCDGVLLESEASTENLSSVFTIYRLKLGFLLIVLFFPISVSSVWRPVALRCIFDLRKMKAGSTCSFFFIKKDARVFSWTYCFILTWSCQRKWGYLSFEYFFSNPSHISWFLTEIWWTVLKFRAKSQAISLAEIAYIDVHVMCCGINFCNYFPTCNCRL